MLKPKGHSAPRSSTLKGANVVASTRRESNRSSFNLPNEFLCNSCTMSIALYNLPVLPVATFLILPEDLELHASVLTLILTLLLTPSGATGHSRTQEATGRSSISIPGCCWWLRRGLLDPNYCDPYPSHKPATQGGQDNERQVSNSLKSLLQVVSCLFSQTYRSISLPLVSWVASL